MGALLAAPAWAQYPAKSVRMLIPFVAGGTTDVLARVVSQQMSEEWKVQVVPDNHPGANGIIAAEIAAKSAGDGYTLLFVAMGHAVNPLMYKKLPYDTEKDFTPICLVATFAQMVLIHPSVPANNRQELIALAKNGPKPLSYASGGIGSSQHLAGALLAYMAGIKMDHVPYKGGSPGLLDVIAGNVNLMVSQPTSMAFITSGKLKALAISSPARSPKHPDLPTVSEAGVPGYQSAGLVRPGRAEKPAARGAEKKSAKHHHARHPLQADAGCAQCPGRRPGRRHARRIRRLHQGGDQPLRQGGEGSRHFRRLSVTAG